MPIQRIQNFKVYESVVYNPSHLIVLLFTAKCSTWGKIIQREFELLANQDRKVSEPKFSGKDIQKVFVHIDVDECPRAAYHSDVDVSPNLSILSQL